jgi:hypothetical protein
MVVEMDVEKTGVRMVIVPLVRVEVLKRRMDKRERQHEDRQN